MWPHLDSVLELDVPSIDIMTYLSLMNLHNLELEDDNSKNLQNKISAFLETSANRVDGLLFIDSVLKNNPDMYIKNWDKIVCSILKHHDPCVNKKTILGIFNSVVTNSTQGTVYAGILPTVVPKVLPLLMEIKDENFQYACQTIGNCMKYVPELLTNHMVDIENYLLQHINCLAPETAESIGDCFAALPMCLLHFRNKSIKNYSYICLEVFTKTLNTVEAILNKIDFSEEECDMEDRATFQINISNDIGFMSQIRIFCTLCRCLAKMLSSNVGIKISVPVQDLLKCLVRIFNTDIFVKHSQKSMSFVKEGFPLMLKSVHFVIEALLLNVDILDQSANFVYVLEKSLEVVAFAKYSTSMSSQTKRTIWNLINVWVTKYSTKGVYDLCKSEYLLTEMLNDIIPSNDDKSKLVVTYSDKKELGRKIACCKAALKVIHNLLLTGAQFLESSFVESVTSLVINIVKNVQLNLHGKLCPVIYSDAKCRKALYNLLLACSTYVEPLNVKTNAKAVSLFNMAAQDPSPEVTLVCQKAFRSLKQRIHSFKPPPDIKLYRRVEVDRPMRPSTAHMDREQWLETWNVPHFGMNGHTPMDRHEEEMGPQVENTFQQYENGDEDESMDHSPEYSEAAGYYSPPAKQPSQVEDVDSVEEEEAESAHEPQSFQPVVGDVTRMAVHNSLGLEDVPLVPEVRTDQPIVVRAVHKKPADEQQQAQRVRSLDSDVNCVEVDDEDEPLLHLEVSENGMDESEDEDDSGGDEDEEEEVEEEEEEADDEEEGVEESVEEVVEEVVGFPLEADKRSHEFEEEEGEPAKRLKRDDVAQVEVEEEERMEDDDDDEKDLTIDEGESDEVEQRGGESDKAKDEDDQKKDEGDQKKDEGDQKKDESDQKKDEGDQKKYEDDQKKDLDQVRGDEVEPVKEQVDEVRVELVSDGGETFELERIESDQEKELVVTNNYAHMLEEEDVLLKHKSESVEVAEKEEHNVNKVEENVVEFPTKEAKGTEPEEPTPTFEEMCEDFKLVEAAEVS